MSCEKRDIVMKNKLISSVLALALAANTMGVIGQTPSAKAAACCACTSNAWSAATYVNAHTTEQIAAMTVAIEKALGIQTITIVEAIQMHLLSLTTVIYLAAADVVTAIEKGAAGNQTAMHQHFKTQNQHISDISKFEQAYDVAERNRELTSMNTYASLCTDSAATNVVQQGNGISRSLSTAIEQINAKKVTGGQGTAAENGSISSATNHANLSVGFFCDEDDENASRIPGCGDRVSGGRDVPGGEVGQKNNMRYVDADKVYGSNIPNGDIRPGFVLFDNDTIEFKGDGRTSTEELAARLLVDNLVGPIKPDTPSPSTYKTPDGGVVYALRRSWEGRTQVATDALNYIQSMHMGSVNAADWINELRAAKGLSPRKDDSTLVSEYEAMKTLFYDQFGGAGSFIEVATSRNPVNLQQQTVQLIGTLIKLNWYQFKMMERQLAIQAIMLARQVEQDGATTPAGGFSGFQ